MSEALVWLTSEEIRECFGLLMGDLCNPVNCKLQHNNGELVLSLKVRLILVGLKFSNSPMVTMACSIVDAFKLSCLGDYGLR